METAAKASDQTRIATLQRIGAKRTRVEASLSPPLSATQPPLGEAINEVDMVSIPSSAPEYAAPTPTNYTNED